MSDLKLNAMDKGITDLAKAVTASETVWKSFQMDPNTYAKKHGYGVSLSDSQVGKIKDTSYADAKVELTSLDLTSLDAKLW